MVLVVVENKRNVVVVVVENNRNVVVVVEEVYNKNVVAVEVVVVVVEGKQDRVSQKFVPLFYAQ